eukprot:Tbor_TRINITY_DN4388_c0_g1::TRINITY_DN4388_c0_g1_i1::g.7859::m.7859
MLSRRFATSIIGSRAIFTVTPVLMTNRNKNQILDEDDRWLEAMFDDKEKSQEERYANEKQRRLMKNIVSKMRDEHKEEVHTVVTKHKEEAKAETEELKEMIAKLSKKLDDITNKK